MGNGDQRLIDAMEIPWPLDVNTIAWRSPGMYDNIVSYLPVSFEDAFMARVNNGLIPRTFRFSPMTIQRLQRIRESWCNAHNTNAEWYRQHITNTEVIRRLVNLEADRLDKEAAAIEEAKKPVEKKAKNKPAKKGK